jgi:hypothetical protein
MAFAAVMQPLSVESETPQQPWDEDDHEHNDKEQRSQQR